MTPHEWYETLPTCDRKRWSKYAKHSNGNITVISPENENGPPPVAGFKLYGQIDKRFTWGVKAK